MKKMYIDVNQTNLINVSRVLLQRSDLTWQQKLFLIEIVDYQAKSKIPYLSQTQFAKSNNISTDTVSRHLTKLYERDIISNLGQVADGLACEFYISGWFMKELGYTDTPVSYVEPVEEVIEVVEVEKPSIVITNFEEPALTEANINYVLTDVLGRPFNTFNGYFQAYNKAYPQFPKSREELQGRYNDMINPF